MPNVALIKGVINHVPAPLPLACTTLTNCGIPTEEQNEVQKHSITAQKFQSLSVLVSTYKRPEPLTCLTGEGGVCLTADLGAYKFHT